MKRRSVTCIFRLLSLIVTVHEVSPAVASLVDPNSPCDPTACPNPICADPTPPTGGACCPSCEGSKCLFKGCVHWAAFGPQWRPDPCTLCTCSNGMQLCSATQCAMPNCFGYPVRTKPGACCPECDYRVPLDQCKPVVVKNETLSVIQGVSTCEAAVLLHHCDKTIAIKSGRIFMCQSVTSDVEIQPERCSGQKLTYKDVVACNLTPADIMDYDTKSSECEMYV